MKSYKESLFDLTLTYASKELVAEIADKYPDSDELKGKYEFSPELEKWVDELLQKDKKKSRHKKHKDNWKIVLLVIKRGAITICAAIALFALMAFSIPSLRVLLVNYAIELNEKNVSMKLENEAEGIQGAVNNVVSYVPEGFETIEEVDNDNLHIISYANENNEIIQFEQYTGSVSLTIDSEESEFEKIVISGVECYITTKNGINMIVFNTKNYGYKISSVISMEELKKMSESLIK